jgi:mandelate racemase
MDASHPKIRRLRATPINVPLARPHPTASGVVSSAPLVLMDLETDQGLLGPQGFTGMAMAPVPLESRLGLVPRAGNRP